MKVYRKIVIDMNSDQVIEEDSFEYSGSVAECKGGSSGYDAAYNSRMADIAEDTFALSETAFDSWNKQDADGNYTGARGLEEAKAAAGIDLVKPQADFEKAQFDYGKSQMDYGLKTLEKKGSLLDKFYSSIGQHDENTEAARAGADVASAISSQKGTAMRDAQRRGVNYKPGGDGLNAAKLKVGAMTTARENTRARNLNEYATGLQI